MPRPRGAAAAGALDTDAGVARAVERLLADPRARALGTGFAAQWLQLTGLEQREMDVARFPGWNARLAASMRAETLRTFDSRWLRPVRRPPSKPRGQVPGSATRSHKMVPGPGFGTKSRDLVPGSGSVTRSRDLVP